MTEKTTLARFAYDMLKDTFRHDCYMMKDNSRLDRRNFVDTMTALESFLMAKGIVENDFVYEKGITSHINSRHKWFQFFDKFRDFKWFFGNHEETLSLIALRNQDISDNELVKKIESFKTKLKDFDVDTTVLFNKERQDYIRIKTLDLKYDAMDDLRRIRNRVMAEEEYKERLEYWSEMNEKIKDYSRIYAKKEKNPLRKIGFFLQRNKLKFLAPLIISGMIFAGYHSINWLDQKYKSRYQNQIELPNGRVVQGKKTRSEKNPRYFNITSFDENVLEKSMEQAQIKDMSSSLDGVVIQAESGEKEYVLYGLPSTAKKLYNVGDSITFPTVRKYENPYLYKILKREEKIRFQEIGEIEH